MPRPEFRTEKEIVDSMIRVDHAGEYGAMRIYQGQLAATQDTATKELISHMQDQEKRHLEYFEEQIESRGTRPTMLLPIWHYASYALGFATAFMGKKTAMLCTQAVEEVIDEHYQEQLMSLKDNKSERELLERIKQFRQEELEHKDIALEHGSMEAPMHMFIHKLIASLCQLAITASKKI